MFRSIAITLALCLATVTAQAALLGRAALTQGGTDYQAYYQEEGNITWVADASLAATSGYDDDGFMDWSRMQAWMASLNSANYLGVSDWRLPTVMDSAQPGCNQSFRDTDCGYNVDTSTGEMAQLFYDTLEGNSAFYNSGGNLTFCSGSDQPRTCMQNHGPFANIKTNSAYWTGTQYALDPTWQWYFHFATGEQGAYFRTTYEWGAWAVVDGDPLAAVVPTPPAVYLFSSALGLMGWLRRKAIA